MQINISVTRNERIQINLLTHLLGQSLEELSSNVSAYRDSFLQNNPSQKTGHVTLMLHTFVGEDREAVKDKVRKPFCGYLRDSVELIGNLARTMNLATDFQEMAPEDMDALLSRAFERYFESSGLFGTPEECLSMVEMLEQIGVDEIACLIDFGVDENAVLESLEHLDVVRRKSLERFEMRASERPALETPAANAADSAATGRTTPP